MRPYFAGCLETATFGLQGPFCGQAEHRACLNHQLFVCKKKGKYSFFSQVAKKMHLSSLYLFHLYIYLSYFNRLGFVVRRGGRKRQTVHQPWEAFQGQIN